jgi:GGDEF domain-containing protein
LPLLPELARLANPPLSLTCSIGIATFPIHASVPSDLIVAADIAVYNAKNAGKNCIRMAIPAAPPTPLVRS